MDANTYCARTDLVIESSYIEDGVELNVLVSPKVYPEDNEEAPEPRWTIIADPKTRDIIRVDFCVATDDGFEYPEYKPTENRWFCLNDLPRSVNEIT